MHSFPHNDISRTFRRRVETAILQPYAAFRNAKHKYDTALSSYFWELKKKTSEIPKLTW